MRRQGLFFIALICAAVTGAAGCTTAGDGGTAALLTVLREPYQMECTVTLPGENPVQARYTHTASDDSIELLDGACTGCFYIKRCGAFFMRCGAVEGAVAQNTGGMFDLFSLFTPNGKASSGTDAVHVLCTDGGEVRFLNGIPFEAKSADGIRVAVLSFEPSAGQKPAADGGEDRNDTG